MNPWLEAHWSDIHSRLSLYACDAIEKVLPHGLQARIEEYLAVQGPLDREDSVRRIVPDISLVEPHSIGPVLASKGTTVLEGAEPIVIRRTTEPMTLRYIEIIDPKAAKRVITAIEFISPANKTELGAIHYRKKQLLLMQGGVHLVEIDLLRRGEWIVAADRSYYPRTVAFPYRICVTRATTPDQSEVYRASWDAPLPSIRIPLRPNEADIRLPLQEILNQAYLKGRYGDSLDYDIPPEIPLSDADQAQVASILSSVTV